MKKENHSKILKEENSLEIKTLTRLTVTKKGTNEVVKVIESHNIICNEGKKLITGFLADESAVYDVGITFQEIGTGTDTPLVGDTTLTAYSARHALTSAVSAANVLTSSFFWTAAESPFNIKEAAVWGGSGANAGEATGLLFAHWLIAFDNSGTLYDLTFEYILTLP